jgi:hypothetical protein
LRYFVNRLALEGSWEAGKLGARSYCMGRRQGLERRVAMLLIIFLDEVSLHGFCRAARAGGLGMRRVRIAPENRGGAA